MINLNLFLDNYVNNDGSIFTNFSVMNKKIIKILNQELLQYNYSNYLLNNKISKKKNNTYISFINQINIFAENSISINELYSSIDIKFNYILDIDILEKFINLYLLQNNNINNNKDINNINNNKDINNINNNKDINNNNKDINNIDINKDINNINNIYIYYFVIYQQVLILLDNTVIFILT